MARSGVYVWCTLGLGLFTVRFGVDMSNNVKVKLSAV